MVESMLKGHCRTIQENQHLIKALRNCTNAIRTNSEVIAKLECEIEQLKDELKKLKPHGDESFVDCDKKIEELIGEITQLKLPSIQTSSHGPNLSESNNHGSSLDQESKIDKLLKPLESPPKQSDAAVETDEESHTINCIRKDVVMILSQQLALSEEQSISLIDECKNLLKINRDLMNSISLCRKELCAYDIE